MIFKTNIRPGFVSLLLALFCILSASCLRAGEPFRGDSANKTKPVAKTPGTTQLTTFKSLSKNRLAELIDSLLDLDSISPKEIELMTGYATILKSTKDEEGVHTLSTAIPGSEYYDEFDYGTIFNITPEDSFPETQFLLLQSDSLGSYYHPRKDRINSPYGWREGKMHRGMDIDLEKGDQVVAAFDGMVRIAQRHNAFGNVVIIRHYNGLETVYGHLSKLKVKPGQHVLSGQMIGLGGSTGRSTGPHLHFEVRFKGQSLNPSNFIDFKECKIACDTLVIKKSKYGIVAYPSNAKLHSVVKGDSWFEIAKQYGLSVKQLLALNGSEKKYYLRIGQKIRIN
jgi:murein DD-endopeptidase MepM/ murein hydrolase activator NlpD